MINRTAAIQWLEFQPLEVDFFIEERDLFPKLVLAILVHDEDPISGSEVVLSVIADFVLDCRS